MRSGCGSSSMSHRLSSDSPVAAPAEHHAVTRSPGPESLWGGFGATVKDTLAQGTGHGGGEEEIAGETGTGENCPVYGGEGPWLVLSKVAAVAGRWRHPPFLPPPRNR